MTDVVHAAGVDGLFASKALCGADAGIAGNLWLSVIANDVTCAVCRDLNTHRPPA